MNYVQITSPCPALFYRRIAALLYDSLIIVAILILATLFILPFSPHHVVNPGNIYYRFYLLVCWFGFVGWFWTHGGQTLGMLAWRLRCVKAINGATISWKAALLRFVSAFVSYACFGLGMVWMLFDKQHRTWQDIISATQIVRCPALSRPTQH